ncbi:restriction endonuclease subunit S [Helcococcus kunzii]|uniref:restriction endonuclease subunit S n=1 Tax=Helcococcus kunzii TaxID=40091 RepID=UPI0024ADB188|nr:restriction endonuclease subunit S [Helcococcus kunzii]
MAEKKRIPEIRFNGFEEEWEEKRFDEIVNRVSNTSSDVNLPRVEYEDIVSERGLLNKDIYEKKSNKSGIKFTKNDILFGKLRPYLKNWILSDFSGIAVGDFWVLRPKEENSSKYIYYFIQSSEFEYLANLSTGTKMPRSDWNLIKSTSFKIPKKLEQEKIGTLFYYNDYTINNIEKNIENLSIYKQSMLQKMFPKQGKKVPEVRFEGFEGEWEEKKIEDCYVDSGSGGTPKSSNKEFYGGEIPFLSITDITNSNGVIYKTEKNITTKGLESSAARMFPKNSLSLAMYASVGKIAIMGTNMATSQAFYNMTFNSEVESKFMYFYLKLFEITNGWRHLIETGTQGNLNASIVKNRVVKIPSLPEQKQIGTFFKSLDNQISLQQQKLDTYKSLKKTLLDKMLI